MMGRYEPENFTRNVLILVTLACVGVLSIIAGIVTGVVLFARWLFS